MRSQLSREEAERLVQTYSDLILRLSFTYLKNTEDAKDICQTVFLKLWEKAPRLRLPGPRTGPGSSAPPPTPVKTC